MKKRSRVCSPATELLLYFVSVTYALRTSIEDNVSIGVWVSFFGVTIMNLICLCISFLGSWLQLDRERREKVIASRWYDSNLSFYRRR